MRKQASPVSIIQHTQKKARRKSRHFLQSEDDFTVWKRRAFALHNEAGKEAGCLLPQILKQEIWGWGWLSSDYCIQNSWKVWTWEGFNGSLVRESAMVRDCIGLDRRLNELKNYDLHEAAHHLFGVFRAPRVGKTDEWAIDSNPGAPF